jgi:pyrophosphate--fructose-6-phosphate 1-phosphotransferase
MCFFGNTVTALFLNTVGFEREEFSGRTSMVVHSFEESRRSFQPVIPKDLHDIVSCQFIEERVEKIDPEIREIFSHLESDEVRKLQEGGAITLVRKPLRVGVVLSGGPAPGGHTVIAGLFDAISEWHEESSLIGFLNGPKGLINNDYRILSKPDIDSVRNLGGFYLIGSGRTKIEQEHLASVMQTAEAHQLDGLVIIGGDDSNTDAVFLSESFRRAHKSTFVVGVPKTIDGDLQSADIPISFGFDTACKVYSQIIGNIAKDMLSNKKYYYFIRLMGRIASHITLECALQTHPNMALISEEVLAQKKTLKDLICDIADLVQERYHQHKQYGLILVPEGVIEHIVDVKLLIAELNELLSPNHPLVDSFQLYRSRSERLDFILDHISEGSHRALSLFPRHIAEQLVHDRDPHGNVQVSKIETERLFASLVEDELKRRSKEALIPISVQTAFCGYEGRSAYPSYFDCSYCYALGRLAAVLVTRKMTGYMTAIRSLHRPVSEWEAVAVPLVSLLQFERRKGADKPVIRRTLVDLEGAVFRHFVEKRASWRLDDQYRQPPPIQFWGPEEIVENSCFTISLRPT